MKHNIIFHNQDLDGWTSGAICRQFLLESGIFLSDINLIPWNYGDPSPIQVDGDIYILDVCLAENDMLLIRSNIGRVTWIDHHASSIKDSLGKWDWLEGLRRVGDSAAKLAWEYFFPRRALPDLVYWVDRYDVWKKTDPVEERGAWDLVMEYQWGMRSNLKMLSNTEDDVALWAGLISYGIADYHMDGELIYKFIASENEKYAKRAFDLEFEGLLFCALNQGEVNSEVVKSVVLPEHDGILTFKYDKGIWRVSLYENELSPADHDLSVIAKRYKGGGHRGACGFEISDIRLVLEGGMKTPVKYSTNAWVELQKKLQLNKDFRVCLRDLAPPEMKFDGWLQEHRNRMEQAVGDILSPSWELDNTISNENPDGITPLIKLQL